MSSYPTTAYRAGERLQPNPTAPVLPGFQRPEPGKPNGPMVIPRPANDPRLPANGNTLAKLERLIDPNGPTFGKKPPAPLPAPAGTPVVFRFPWSKVFIPLRLGNQLGQAYELWQIVKPGYQPGSAPSGYSLVDGPWSYTAPWNTPNIAPKTYTYIGPIAGQYTSPLEPGFTPASFGLWWKEDPLIAPGAQPRFAHHSSYSKTGFAEPGKIEEFTEQLNSWLNGEYVGETELVPSPEADPSPGPVPYWAIPYIFSPPLPNGAPSRGSPSAAPSSWPNGQPNGLSSTTTVNPNGSTSTVTAPVPTVRTPPPEGTKERKQIMAVRGIVSLAFNIATETSDAIDSFWEAIPEKYRPGMKWLKPSKRFPEGKWVRKWNPNPYWKAKYIYENYGLVNLKEAIINLSKNEIEDKLIGGANKQLTKKAAPWYRKSGRMHGFGAGPAM